MEVVDNERRRVGGQPDQCDVGIVPQHETVLIAELGQAGYHPGGAGDPRARPRRDRPDELARASDLAAGSGSRRLRLEVELARARVAAANGDSAAARQSVDVVCDPQQQVVQHLCLEARVVGALLAGGSAATAELDAVESEAREMGLGLVVRHVEAARSELSAG